MRQGTAPTIWTMRKPVTNETITVRSVHFKAAPSKAGLVCQRAQWRDQRRALRGNEPLEGTMAYEHILVDAEDGVGVVTLNRPASSTR